MSLEFNKAEEIIAHFKNKVQIEYTQYAGAKTEYSSLNEREAIQCAIVAVGLIINESLDNQFQESYYKKVLEILKTKINAFN